MAFGNTPFFRAIASNITELKHGDTKLGIQRKRLKIGWDEHYLAKLLFEAPKTTTPMDPSAVSSARCSRSVSMPWS